MKIMVLTGFDRSLVHFRGQLLATFAEAGHEVLGAAPAQTAGVPQDLSRLGVRFVPVKLNRAGFNPLSDLGVLWRFIFLFRRERPDLLLSYTAKAVAYGSLAARIAGVPRRVALITGLGAAFHTPGIKGRILAFVGRKLYRWAFRQCYCVVVQNRDIAAYFLQHRLLPDLRRLHVVPGSGVDLDRFAAKPFPCDGTPCFLLMGRLLWDKGILEYVEAAAIVRREFPQARFLLLGDVDPNPSAIDPAQLARWGADGHVEFLPFAPDVRRYLEQCTTYVLPSYHEGLPRSVIEAMAVGRPVITTDVIGCRDTIFGAELHCAGDGSFRVGENGLLVPVRNSAALAAAMCHMCRLPQLAEQMGRRGRQLAEQHYDVRKITAEMICAMGMEKPRETKLARPMSTIT